MPVINTPTSKFDDSNYQLKFPMLMTPPLTERDNEDDKSQGRGNIIINITD